MLQADGVGGPVDVRVFGGQPSLAQDDIIRITCDICHDALQSVTVAADLYLAWGNAEGREAGLIRKLQRLRECCGCHTEPVSHQKLLAHHIARCAAIHQESSRATSEGPAQNHQIAVCIHDGYRQLRRRVCCGHRRHRGDQPNIGVALRLRRRGGSQPSGGIMLGLQSHGSSQPSIRVTLRLRKHRGSQPSGGVMLRLRSHRGSQPSRRITLRPWRPRDGQPSGVRSSTSTR